MRDWCIQSMMAPPPTTMTTAMAHTTPMKKLKESSLPLPSLTPVVVG
jgi:hypothetical protein